MNQRQLECFFAVARERHFRRAAESLFLGQGTVSDAIAALERSLGGRLFIRSTRQVELSPLGYELLAATLGPYERLQAAFDTVRHSTRRRPELVIGHTPELGQLLLPRLIDLKEIAVDGVTDSDREHDHGTGWTPRRLHTHQQIAALRSHEIDLGLSWLAQVDGGLTVHELLSVPYVAVLRADEPLAAEPSVRIAQLAGRRLIITPRAYNTFIAGQLDSALAAAGVATDTLDEFPHFAELSLQVATSVASAGLHPAPIALLDTTPGLVFRVVTDPGLTLTMCAVVRTDDAAAAALVGRLKAVADRVEAELVAALEPVTPQE